jgi:hypothetical protein
MSGKQVIKALSEVELPGTPKEASTSALLDALGEKSELGTRRWKTELLEEVYFLL